MEKEIEINTGNSSLDSKILEYLKWNKSPGSRKEVLDLIKSKNVKELENLFLKRLEFGTAGLRGRMGPGYNQMNDLVIIQTDQGLVKYLLNTISYVKEKGVIIGYDGRHNSKRFAELTATIFLNNGFKTYMFSDICPTPFIPFGVLKYKCGVGIMITASHNPKDDNGYKVYWENGAQIISPHDKEIQKCIIDCLEPQATSWDTEIIINNPLFKDPLNEIMIDYFEVIKETTLFPEINEKCNLKFVYTPMHGVGYKYMTEAFKAANFKPFIVVEEQKTPDPEFPTVKFPNPEEGKSALDLSIKTAEKNNASIILANDPDADRLACATKKKTGEWHVFTGNELGALLGWWMLYVHQQKYPKKNIGDSYMMASTVSSKILKTMAKKQGFKFEETLTGFKWMGNKCIDLIKKNKDVLFAFEEAIGFMCGSKVLDKDGISAGVRLAELTAYLDVKMGMTLMEKLIEIYQEYGYHISDNSYWICYDQETITSIFNRLRNFDGKPNTVKTAYCSLVCIICAETFHAYLETVRMLEKFQSKTAKYPRSISGGKYMITGVRDLTTGYDNTQPNNEATLPTSKSSQMITFTFANGLVTTLRTSGTEPKIKYYTELCAPPEFQNVDELTIILSDMVSALVNEFLQPQKNALITRSF